MELQIPIDSDATPARPFSTKTRPDPTRPTFRSTNSLHFLFLSHPARTHTEREERERVAYINYNNNHLHCVFEAFLHRFLSVAALLCIFFSSNPIFWRFLNRFELEATGKHAMDQKSWLWKIRSTEKTLVADKASNSLSKHDEDENEDADEEDEKLNKVQKLLIEKTDLERNLRISNEKLSSALSECNAKDNIAKKQVKIAEEAIAGWEKAQIEAISLKQELDKVLQKKATSDERIGHLDAALKECMLQLRFV
ncbi:hypothetical protein ABFS82_11G087500 [Erythranthe guttata]